MDNTLIDSLASAGHRTEIWESPDGSVALVLPYGGRILGLFAPGSSQNFLWTHPALQSAETAKAFYRSSDWHNSGGDRTWLAPEVDFFVPNFPELDAYVQPREFDPGSYHLYRENGYITLSNQFSSKLSRSGRTAHLKITKQLKPARNPLRNTSPELTSRLTYAGYSLKTRLEFTDRDRTHPQVGLWSLLQMPHGGELVVPTFSRSTVRLLVGKIDPQHLSVSDHAVRYRMNSAGEHKLGLSAAAVSGRAGYVYSTNDGSCLVIRNFTVNPSGEYIDVPWHDTQRDGTAIQACNVNSKLGAFSELEYHAPAIGGDSTDAFAEDESQVWAFNGAEEDIRQVGSILLLHEF